MMNKKNWLLHFVMIVTLLIFAALGLASGASVPDVPKPEVFPPIPEGQSQIILPETVTIKSINGQRNQMGKGLIGGNAGKSQAFIIPSGNHDLVLDYKHGVGRGDFFVWGIEMKHNFLPGRTYAVVGEASWGSGSYSIVGQGVRLYIIDATDNSLFHIKNPEKTWPADATYSPDGSKIAFCSGKNIYIHNSVNGELISKLTGHGKRITTIRFNSKGDRLFSSSEDKTIRVWNIDGNNASSTLITASQAPVYVGWSADSNFIAMVHNNKIDVYNTSTGQIINTFTGYTKVSLYVQIAFSPDNSRILLVNTIRGLISHKTEAILWELHTGRQIAKMEYDGFAGKGIAWYPEKNQIALSIISENVNHKGTIPIIDDTLQVKNKFRLFPEFNGLYVPYCEWPPRLYVKPDGREMTSITDGVSVSITTTINVFDTETGNIIRSITGQSSASSPYHAAYSPDGRRIALLSSDGIRVWNSDFNK